MRAREIIKKLIQDKNRAVALEFFLYFSRFEYALKREGYTKKTKNAEAAWDEYASKHAHVLTGNRDKEFKDAVAYLTKFPPKKQIIDASGQLGFEADSHSGAIDLKWLLMLVRRIRNNLFHGGKFQSGLESSLSRDKILLNAALVILEACLDADEKLARRFMNELSG